MGSERMAVDSLRLTFGPASLLIISVDLWQGLELCLDTLDQCRSRHSDPVGRRSILLLFDRLQSPMVANEMPMESMISFSLHPEISHALIVDSRIARLVQ